MFICVFIEKQAFKWNQKLYNLWSNDTFKHCEVLRTFLPGSTWYEKHTICHALLRPICPQSCCTIFRLLLVQDKAMKNVAIILNYRLPLLPLSTQQKLEVELYFILRSRNLVFRNNRRTLSWKQETQQKKTILAKLKAPKINLWFKTSSCTNHCGWKTNHERCNGGVLGEHKLLKNKKPASSYQLLNCDIGALLKVLACCTFQRWKGDQRNWDLPYETRVEKFRKFVTPKTFWILQKQRSIKVC